MPFMSLTFQDLIQMHTDTFHHLKPHIATNAINITIRLEKVSEVTFQAWEGS